MSGSHQWKHHNPHRENGVSKQPSTDFGASQQQAASQLSSGKGNELVGKQDNVALLEDDSPYIIYGGEVWGGDHKGDPFTSKYTSGSFHSSTEASSWAGMSWNGTDVIVYGAKRPNHGYYAVIVDNGAVQYFDGYSATNDILIPLYSSKNLDDREHQILIVNQNQYKPSPGRIWLDIDQIKITGVPIDPNSAASISTDVVGSIMPTTLTSTDMQTSFTTSTSTSTAMSSSSTSDPLVVVDSTTVITVTSARTTSISSISHISSSNTSASQSITSSRPTGGAAIQDYQEQFCFLLTIMWLFVFTRTQI